METSSGPPPKPPKPPAKPPKPTRNLSENDQNSSLSPPLSPSSPSPSSIHTNSNSNSTPPPLSPPIPPPKPPPPPIPQLKSESSNSSINSPSSPSPSSNTPQSLKSDFSFSTIKNSDDNINQKSGRKKSLQASLSQLTGLLGISEQTEYSSKKYNNPEEANLRLNEINAALDGLNDPSDESDTSDQQPETLGEGLIREGFLSKTNRDGMEKYYFILTSQYLSYCAEKILTTTTRLNHKRSIPLSTIIIKDANDDFKISKNPSPTEMTETKNKTLLILSKEKSFHLTASTVSDRNQWFEDIQRASRALQSNLNINLNENSMSPVWNPDYTTTACEICSAEFTFFFRRHHCRNCGKCLCENCCNEKCRIPRIDSRKLLLVCSVCAAQLKSTRTYGVPGYVPQK